jgi:hypothetical protein
VFGDNPVMLCWESAPDCQSGKAFCHRHLVAQWLEDRLGIEVEEVIPKRGDADLSHPKLDRFAFPQAQGIEAPDYRTSTSDRLIRFR